mgnify:CR=1 FL=1
MNFYYVKNSFNSADSFGTDIDGELMDCYDNSFDVGEFESDEEPVRATLEKQGQDDLQATKLLEAAGYESGLGTGGPSYVANLYKQDDDGNEFAVEADF